jgi:hypothetical protein
MLSVCYVAIHQSAGSKPCQRAAVYLSGFCSRHKAFVQGLVMPVRNHLPALQATLTMEAVMVAGMILHSSSSLTTASLAAICILM